MIYGPITPRTADALSDVVANRSDVVESGLRIVAPDLCVGGGVRIDRLAVDAAGLPVFVFLAQPGDDRSVPGRVAEALRWFDDCAGALRATLQECGARIDGGVRVLVVGFELTAGTFRQLQELGDPRLEAVQLEPYEVGGERRMGRVALLPSPAAGGATTPAVPAPEDAGAGDAGAGDAAAMPAALLPDGCRAQVLRLADLLHRLEPRLTVGGERYTRTWSCAQGPLLELRRAGDLVEARVASEDRDAASIAPFVPLASDDDVGRVFDGVARRLLHLTSLDDERDAGQASAPASPQRAGRRGRGTPGDAIARRAGARLGENVG